MRRNYVEIESLEALRELLAGGKMLRHYAFQSIDFSLEQRAMDATYTDCLFLGCNLPEQMRERIDANCYVFPSLHRPYDMFAPKLYSAECLYAGYDPEREESFKECYDSRVYAHYLATGKSPGDISESLSRSLHDHSMSDALHDLLAEYDEHDVVAIMGGHSLSRADAVYADVARLSKTLAEQGKLMVSGGGPGAMEATHLGVWFAGRSDEELMAAIATLSGAPRFEDEGWLSLAFKVMADYPRCEEYRSIGIPTWFYGHEPATPFASHIAKYFDNSIREDGLLAIAKGGVVFSPGSAGTMQEIFQDAAQNHYKTFGFASPMVFLGRDYWTRQMPVYPMLENLLAEGKYRNLMLTLTDDIGEAAAALQWDK